MVRLMMVRGQASGNQPARSAWLSRALTPSGPLCRIAGRPLFAACCILPDDLPAVCWPLSHVLLPACPQSRSPAGLLACCLLNLWCPSVCSWLSALSWLSTRRLMHVHWPFCPRPSARCAVTTSLCSLLSMLLVRAPLQSSPLRASQGRLLPICARPRAAQSVVSADLLTVRSLSICWSLSFSLSLPVSHVSAVARVCRSALLFVGISLDVGISHDALPSFYCISLCLSFLCRVS